MHLQFLHGTETSNAELLCADLVAEFGAEYDCSTASLDDVAPTDLKEGVFYVFVCSTFGSGDVPATAERFYAEMQNAKPDLSKIRFAIFGLGDRIFGETFNQGSQKLRDALLSCSATQVGERGIYDTSGDALPEEVAIPWLRALQP